MTKVLAAALIMHCRIHISGAWFVHTCNGASVGSVERKDCGIFQKDRLYRFEDHISTAAWLCKSIFGKVVLRCYSRIGVSTVILRCCMCNAKMSHRTRIFNIAHGWLIFPSSNPTHRPMWTWLVFWRRNSYRFSGAFRSGMEYIPEIMFLQGSLHLSLRASDPCCQLWPRCSRSAGFH